MKSIRLTTHAQEQMVERGATEEEVSGAIQRGVREPAKRGRSMHRLNFQYNAECQGKLYAIKQVAPVVVEEKNEVIVVGPEEQLVGIEILDAKAILGKGALPTVVLDNVPAVHA